VDGHQFKRIGHLAPLTLPGGDRAAKEPWRMAAAVLFDLQRGNEITRRFPDQAGAATVLDMLQRKLNCVTTTSMGRYFDAAAGLLGVSQVQAYEGQAAMLLEGMADRYGKVTPLSGGYTINDDNVLDFHPLLAALADSNDPPFAAALFHATLIAGLTEWLERAAEQTHLDHVALGGGCFLNNVLSQTLIDTLPDHGLCVLSAQQLPPNDGAISLGQASIALQRLNKGV
jgi:hydrogenase maturation protein HypF